ncbi:hypothetical protein D3C71_1764440 [compost metagenome]
MAQWLVISVLFDKTQHFPRRKKHVLNILGFDIAGDPLTVISIEIEHVVEMSNFARFEILKRRENDIFIASTVFESVTFQQ